MMSAEIESILFQEGEVVKFEKEDIEDLGIFIEEISAGLNKRAGDAVKIGDDGGERVDPSLNERVGSSPNDLKKSEGVEEMFSEDDERILETTKLNNKIITIEDGTPLTPVGECFSLPYQVSAPVQSILKKGENKKMVYAKKSGVNEKKVEKKKNKIISACQRYTIIRTLMIQGVKKGSELPFKKMWTLSSQIFHIKRKD